MKRFNLIFSGEISPEFNLLQVKQNFKKRFRLSDLQVEKIFSGKNVILKKNLSEEDILKYVSVIDELGGVSYFEDSTILNLPPGVTKDRRRFDRRTRTDRRKVYRSSITADRRIHQDRRRAA